VDIHTRGACEQKLMDPKWIKADRKAADAYRIRDALALPPEE
jgi:hypothetical protein